MAEHELGGNQKLVGGAQRGMSHVTSEAPFAATMDTSPASDVMKSGSQKCQMVLNYVI